jgi:hypothetical protein
MKQEDKILAEKVLNHLCQGGQISGIRFGPILQLLISTEDSKEKLRGQINLNLGSKWTVFKSLPAQPPENESDFAETTREQDLQFLCGIREAEISRVELGNNSPHLFIHLTDRRILYVNGHHEMYECWDLGLAFNDPKETWNVVASPGDGVTVFAPEKFIKSPAPRSIIYEENNVTMIKTKAINSRAVIIQRLVKTNS